MRKCNYCNEEKDESEFYDRNLGKRKMYRCKSCEKEKIKRWRDKNPEKNKAIYRKARLKAAYKLHPDEVITFGECPLCNKTKRLLIDHCHKQGHVRGFICYNCNTTLGHIENKEKMEKFQEYINNAKITSRYYDE